MHQYGLFGILPHYVLKQRAPHRHIQKLNAPADPEDGFFARGRAPAEFDLEQVSLLRKRAVEGEVHISVEPGVDIVPARQQKSVEVCHRRLRK